MLDSYVLHCTSKLFFQSWHSHVFLGDSQLDRNTNLELGDHMVSYTSYLKIFTYGMIIQT